MWILDPDCLIAPCSFTGCVFLRKILGFSPHPHLQVQLLHKVVEMAELTNIKAIVIINVINVTICMISHLGHSEAGRQNFVAH